MTQANSLAKRFRDVIINGKWIAFTNMKEQISDLTWEQATTKVHDLNTVAALTFHLNYYIAGVLQVLEGGELTIKDKFSWDMSPITNESEWDSLRQSLFTNAERFASLIDALSDSQLQSHFVKEDYGTYQRNIEGMIEHCYYHFGQVVIIKKMVIASLK